MTSDSASAINADDLRIDGIRSRLPGVESTLADLVAGGVDALVLRDGTFLIGDASAAVTQSEARYRHLINRMDGLVAELRPSGEILYLNAAMSILLGHSAAAMGGGNFFDQLFQLQIAANSKALKTQFLEADELNAFQTVFRAPDGSEKILSWNAAHVVDASGQLERLIFLAFDVTAQVAAERESRVAAIAFESQEGMTVTDAHGTILRVNGAFSKITGYSAGEALGNNPRLLKSGRHDAAFYAAMWGELAKNGIWQGEIWNRRKCGEVYPEWLAITAVKTEQGQVTHYVGTFLDNTLRKAAASEIERLAFYDPLTQLANRRLAQDRLTQALAASFRRNRVGALMLIDIDNFKTLNDSLGHDVGDKLLVEVGVRLASCVREGDTVARFGGDEFVVILQDLQASGQAAAQAEAVASKIQARLRQEYWLELNLSDGMSNKRRHHCSASIGITLFHDGLLDPDILMKQADLAMYQAKAAGRNTLRFFDAEMQQAVNQRSELEGALRRAIGQEQFVLFYQTQVDRSGQHVGAEALIRWLHPERGLINPNEFIGFAEETDLILAIGRWVLQTACTQLARWAKQPDLSHLTLAVNISARQFHHDDFVAQVIGLLEQTGANPKRLKLELTESLLIQNLDDVISKMHELKRQGIIFSLDDFGTGYSSLAYLKRLPIDQLKIDQSFVHDALNSFNDAAIVKTVVALGQTFGLEVIAEGVETQEQREFLANISCLLYQGYLYSRPLPVAEFEALVQGGDCAV
jgi:diguanylate cyclase (GGDEF)-like protein/PAS domain S-box-containing protein